MALSIEAQCAQILTCRDDEEGRKKAVAILLGALGRVQTKLEFLTLLGYRNCLGGGRFPALAELDYALLERARGFDVACKLTRHDIREILLRTPEGSPLFTFAHAREYG